MELVYLKDRMWCIYIHHRVWICYPNVVRRYGRGMSATCPLHVRDVSHVALPRDEKTSGFAVDTSSNRIWEGIGCTERSKADGNEFLDCQSDAQGIKGTQYRRQLVG